MTLLAGDIGGTKILLGLSDRQPVAAPDEERVECRFPVADWHGAQSASRGKLSISWRRCVILNRATCE